MTDTTDNRRAPGLTGARLSLCVETQIRVMYGIPPLALVQSPEDSKQPWSLKYLRKLGAPSLKMGL